MRGPSRSTGLTSATKTTRSRPVEAMPIATRPDSCQRDGEARSFRINQADQENIFPIIRGTLPERRRSSQMTLLS